MTMDITKYSPGSGQLIKDDGSIINIAELIETIKNKLSGVTTDFTLYDSATSVDRVMPLSGRSKVKIFITGTGTATIAFKAVKNGVEYDIIAYKLGDVTYVPMISTVTKYGYVIDELDGFDSVKCAVSNLAGGTLNIVGC